MPLLWGRASLAPLFNEGRDNGEEKEGDKKENDEKENNEKEGDEKNEDEKESPGASYFQRGTSA